MNYRTLFVSHYEQFLFYLRLLVLASLSLPADGFVTAGMSRLSAVWDVFFLKVCHSCPVLAVLKYIASVLGT
jgi:hypothetical protein